MEVKECLLLCHVCLCIESESPEILGTKLSQETVETCLTFPSPAKILFKLGKIVGDILDIHGRDISKILGYVLGSQLLLFFFF